MILRIFELCGTWANHFWKKMYYLQCEFLIYDYICHKLIYTIKDEKLELYFKSRVVNDIFA